MLFSMTKPKNYVSNADLTRDLSRWVVERKKAIDEGQNKPPLPDSVAEAALKIVTRYANKPNFYSYTFKEDMMGDALLAVVNYVHNFNPEKSNNAFAYITQIAGNAFLRRIEVEKKQTAVKAAYSIELTTDTKAFATQASDTSKSYNNTVTLAFADTAVEVVAAFNERLAAKTSKKSGYRKPKPKTPKAQRELKPNATGYKYVQRSGTRFKVSDGKKHYGSFKTLEEAVTAAANIKTNRVAA